MTPQALLEKIAAKITNPSLDGKGKIALARKEMAGYLLVAEKNGRTPEEIFEIVQRYEDKPGPIQDFEPDTFENEDERLFWEAMQEIELMLLQEK